jgi:FLVCR family feline leukemia virus subgroup C receptor-related protein
MLVSMATQVQWLAHASVMRAASVFYAGQFSPSSIINIDFLAMVYMIVYIVACIPASMIIDKRGIKVGLGIGSLLVALAGLAKGVWAGSFAAQIAAQTVLAVAQPFIINAVTAVSVRWFPLRERGTAAGLASLSQYLGFIVAMGLTPLLVVSDPTRADYGQGMDRALLVYGIFSFAAGIAALLLIKERPANVQSDDSHQYSGFAKEVRAILSHRDMRILILLFFIGLGIMNAVSSMVDSIAGNLGVRDSDGLIGVFMILGGIIGAVIIPMLSDKFRKRKLFLILCIALMIPGMAGLSFAKHLNPFGYGWKTLSAPDGADVRLRSDLPRPSVEIEATGTYVFAFELRDKYGQALDSGTVKIHAREPGSAVEAAIEPGTIEAIRGQAVMLSGSDMDSQVVRSIYILALVSSFLFGFAVMSAGPIGFQYAAEVIHPASESISQGMLLLVGQISGIAFTAGMSIRNKTYIDGFMVMFFFLAIVVFVSIFFMKESPMIVTEKEKYGG